MGMVFQLLMAGTSHHLANINNDDIVTEILYRLPVKSVHRFKCVSQGWLSLITHPLFFQNYLCRLKIPSLGVILQPPSFCKDRDPEFIPVDNRNSAGVPDQTLTSLLRRTNSTILHACNGLFLLKSFKDMNNYSLFVCNPTTMEYVPLPTPEKKFNHGMNLVFDPSKSSAADFKVISVWNPYGSISYQIDVYSSVTGSWRTARDVLSCPGIFMYGQGVLWNNAMNWTSIGDYSVSFDLKKERFRVTWLPQLPRLPQCMGYFTGKRCVMYFGASQGHLHLIEFYGHLTTQFDIFEMEHDFSRWSVRYHVDLYMMKQSFPEMISLNGLYPEYSFLSLLQGAEEGEVMLMINVPGKVISYRVRDGTFFKVCDLRRLIRNTNDIYRYYRHFYFAFPYMSVLHSFRSSSSSH